MNELRESFKELKYPGVEKIRVLKVKTGPPIGKSVAKRITGRDLDQLNQAHKEVFKALTSVKEIINLEGFSQPTKGLLSSSSIQSNLNFFSDIYGFSFKMLY